MEGPMALGPPAPVSKGPRGLQLGILKAALLGVGCPRVRRDQASAARSLEEEGRMEGRSKGRWLYGFIFWRRVKQRGRE